MHPIIGEFAIFVALWKHLIRCSCSSTPVHRTFMCSQGENKACRARWVPRVTTLLHPFYLQGFSLSPQGSSAFVSLSLSFIAITWDSSQTSAAVTAVRRAQCLALSHLT